MTAYGTLRNYTVQLMLLSVVLNRQMAYYIIISQLMHLQLYELSVLIIKFDVSAFDKWALSQ